MVSTDVRGGRPDGVRLSRAVLEAVGERESVELPSLETPLYDSIDPDALDSLFRSGVDGKISFSYLGYDVTVTSGGRVHVDE